MKSFNLIVFSILLSMIGCKKNDESKSKVVFMSALLTVSDSSGRDLLNPAVNSGINYENIDHYYLINGEKVKQNHSNLDYPKKFVFGKDSEKKRYYLNVFLNSDVADGEVSTSIIEYENYSPDTIEVKVHKTANLTDYTELKVNGRVIAENELRNGIAIVK